MDSILDHASTGTSLFHDPLTSDTALGSGEGIAGMLGAEVEHRPATGLPFIRGRTLRGLLVEECANLLYSLQLSDSSLYAQAYLAAGRLFGSPGSRIDTAG